MQLRNKVRLLHFLIKRVKSLKGIAYLKEEMGNVLLSRYLISPVMYLKINTIYEYVCHHSRIQCSKLHLKEGLSL